MRHMALERRLGRSALPSNVLTLIEMSPSRWTARATENLEVSVEADSRVEATKALLRALGSNH